MLRLVSFHAPAKLRPCFLSGSMSSRHLSNSADSQWFTGQPAVRPKRGGGRHSKPGGGGYRGTLKGHGPDRVEVQYSKTMSWLLRHGAHVAGLPMRPDGYARVEDLLQHESCRGLDFLTLEKIVKNDNKQRYDLTYEPGGTATDVWWIRANQGHSMEAVEVSMRQIHAALEVPMAVHGTSLKAWEIISRQGLSRMARNHIHLAQGIVGENVISGMRKSSEILIYINVRKALSAGIKFYLSSNGVVLTPGDEFGLLETRFFRRVERVNVHKRPLPGWEGEAGRADDENVDAGPQELKEDNLPYKIEE